MVLDLIGICVLWEGVAFVPLLPSGFSLCFGALTHRLENPLSRRGSVWFGSEFLLQGHYSGHQFVDQMQHDLWVLLVEMVKFLASHKRVGVYFTSAAQARPEQLPINNIAPDIYAIQTFYKNLSPTQKNIFVSTGI
jgi:hypothetical protein